MTELLGKNVNNFKPFHNKKLYTKGQLISKYSYEKLVSSKIPTKLFLDFYPEIFCSFLGDFMEAFWDSWGLS